MDNAKLLYQNIMNQRQTYLNLFTDKNTNNTIENRNSDTSLYQMLYLDENKTLPPEKLNIDIKSKNLKNEISHIKKKIEKESVSISLLTEKIHSLEINNRLLEIKQNEIRKSLYEIFSDL
jgi:hypothetical protein